MLLDVNDSLLVIIDPQASLMPIIVDADRVVSVSNKLVSISRELQVPFIITEHCPDKLRPTIPEIAKHLGRDYRPIAKRTFSCFGEERFKNTIERTRKKTLVLTGIETHICVLQTAIECKAAGYRVVVVADGVGSRSQLAHTIALRRMERYDVEIFTGEMVAYEWMRHADHPAFKTVLPYIKSGL